MSIKITKEPPTEPTYSISGLTWHELYHLHLIVMEGKRYFIQDRGFGSEETRSLTDEFLRVTKNMLWPT